MANVLILHHASYYIEMIKSFVGSRSIIANIAEGWGKRSYENEFKRQLIYSMGSIEETKVWLNFAKDCNYIEQPVFDKINDALNETGAKIYKLYDNWKSY